MKKLLLILALIGVIVLTAYGALSGTYTTNGYFYLPGYGAYGTAEWTEYNAYMEIADVQIEANKTASGDENIEDIVGAMVTGNTETFIAVDYQDATADMDFVVPVKDEDNMASDSNTFLATQQSIKAYADTLHALQYLKTEMDSFSELQAIIADKTLVNEEDVFTIDANWVNTANPWADNEVADALTVTGYMQDEDINTFSELDAWVTDKTLVNTLSKLSVFAATTSAELAGIISNESGSGLLVYNNSPTLITPALGTPSAGTLTNATGLPIASGVSGLGSNVATFLATPSSANLASALTDETGTGKAVYNIAPILYQNVTTSATTNTLTVAEAGLILVSDAHTETLPTASGNTGLTYHFVKTDADYDLITLEGDGAETFNYENSTGTPNLTYLRLNTYCAEVTIVSDGTNWQVIDEALGQVPWGWLYMSAHQSDFTNSINLRVELDTAYIDIGSNFDNTTWISGNATATTAGHLIDTTNNPFTSDMIKKRIKNTTDTTYTYITVYNSTSDVTVRDNIFVDGEGYELKNCKYVIPISGQYLLAYSVVWTNPVVDKLYTAWYAKNNVDVKGTFIHASVVSYLDNGIAIIDSFSASDYITLSAKSTSGVDTVDMFGSNQTHTFLNIKLISKD